MQNPIRCTTKSLHSGFLEDASPENLKQIIEYLGSSILTYMWPISYQNFVPSLLVIRVQTLFVNQDFPFCSRWNFGTVNL